MSPPPSALLQLFPDDLLPVLSSPVTTPFPSFFIFRSPSSCTTEIADDLLLANESRGLTTGGGLAIGACGPGNLIKDVRAGAGEVERRKVNAL